MYVLSRYPGLIGARCSELRILSNESKTALPRVPGQTLVTETALGQAALGNELCSGHPLALPIPARPADGRQGGVQRLPAPSAPCSLQIPYPEGRRKPVQLSG